MIATITLNPCLDKYISVAHLELNETNRSQPVTQYAGGKGLDVSRAVHEMGGKTMAFGFAGGNEGITLTTLLAQQGVPFSFIPINEETRSCYIISQMDSAQQLRISTPGPGINMQQVNNLTSIVWEMRPAPKLLVCGGSVPPGLPVDVYSIIIHKARRHGIKTVLDSSGIYLKEGIKARPFLIKPNKHEAEELLGRLLASEKEILEAAIEMVRMGARTAVISLGKDGVVAADRYELVKAVPPPVTAVSTVGAGDSAVAGLAIALARGDTLIKACKLAVAMGTAAVLTPGTMLAHRADVDRILPLVRAEKLSRPE
jgi:6-phosphofructokinase 2